MVAPILPFTTEEAWEIMPGFEGKTPSVHLNLFPRLDKERMEALEFQEWEELGQIREHVLKEMELAREAKTIGNSLEAALTLTVPRSWSGLLDKYKKDLATLFIVSSVDIIFHDKEDLEISVAKASGGKCERCWNISDYVGKGKDYKEFCLRCEDVVKEMGL